jgi:hypothetical protein
MMPPKMIKPEIWGRQATSNLSSVTAGNNEIPASFYPELWEEAEGHLAGCRRIVFIGYSFPPADFAVSNMLRRAISTMKVSTNSFPQIDIVDPNAADLAKRFEKSFKINIPVENQYLSLKSYLNSKREK